LAGFSNLEKVNANSCGLKTLDISTFGDYFPPNLKILDLDANEITGIGAKAFVRLSHLRLLYLRNNRITTILQ
jgi:Leucine-rich repeat (LRR) protein